MTSAGKLNGTQHHGRLATMRPILRLLQIAALSGALALAESPAAAAERTDKLFEVMRSQPVFVNGQQAGFRVYPGTRRAEFLCLGLQSGDLLAAIDGKPLSNPGTAFGLLDSILTKPVTLTIVRANAPPAQIRSDLARCEERETI
jgi:hypothetical protein